MFCSPYFALNSTPSSETPSLKMLSGPRLATKGDDVSVRLHLDHHVAFIASTLPQVFD